MRYVHLWAHFYIAYSVVRKWVKDSIITHEQVHAERLHAAQLHLARRQIYGLQPVCDPLVWVVYDDQEVEGDWSRWCDQLRPNLGQAMTLPKVILLDLNMQRQSRKEIFYRLQAIIAYYDLSIIVLTTSNAQLNDEMSIELGTKVFLVKRVKQSIAVTKLEKAANYCKAR